MPFWRALFYWVWFIPLWNKLRADAMLITHAPKMVKSRLAWPLGWFLFFVCVITQFLSDIDESWILTSLLIAITIMPMVIVINTIKGNLDSSYVSNSRWLIRHTILTVLYCSNICLYTTSILLPNTHSVGCQWRQIWAKDIQFMKRNKVIDTNDDPVYFYSDAWLDLREDGNGFNKTQVFSYWKDASNDFNEIENIDVEFGSGNDNSIITVTLKDKTDFKLFVGNEGAGDRVFVKALNQQWKSLKN